MGHPRISAISFLSSGLICKGTCCRTHEAPPPAATNEANCYSCYADWFFEPIWCCCYELKDRGKMERGMAYGGEVDKKNIWHRKITVFLEVLLVIICNWVRYLNLQLEINLKHQTTMRYSLVEIQYTPN